MTQFPALYLNVEITNVLFETAYSLQSSFGTTKNFWTIPQKNLWTETQIFYDTAGIA
jgi:plasmid maintenance system antidote protein VapI